MKLADRIEQMVNPANGLPCEIDNLLDQWFCQKPKSGERVFAPRTNIVERETEFVVTVELPGVDIADVTVEAADARLMISGEKKIDTVGENDSLHRSERLTGKFQRAFEFPTQVDFDRIQANYELGVLNVAVPKSEKVLPRKVEITVNK